ncbi:uncharacterized protein LDX57_001598 [Aspergillus melleus]|uniref:uncharacterized protein n=1 Tax=Aspergillus melleus TaxID=138277 RepID=UPI001E8EC676|nr:uncharacterized protein LDX57_001598 [Aspergillus melleus]KAH8423841.1 hypothetical protein LDX57_001598 [Aspergillus melleus]
MANIAQPTLEASLARRADCRGRNKTRQDILAGEALVLACHQRGPDPPRVVIASWNWTNALRGEKDETPFSDRRTTRYIQCEPLDAPTAPMQPPFPKPPVAMAHGGVEVEEGSDSLGFSQFARKSRQGEPYTLTWTRFSYPFVLYSASIFAQTLQNQSLLPQAKVVRS